MRLTPARVWLNYAGRFRMWPPPELCLGRGMKERWLSSGKMIGREYRHPKLGIVTVLEQPNYRAGGPRNVLIRNQRGDEIVVPQRSLRRI